MSRAASGDNVFDRGIPYPCKLRSWPPGQRGGGARIQARTHSHSPGTSRRGGGCLRWRPTAGRRRAGAIRGLPWPASLANVAETLKTDPRFAAQGRLRRLPARHPLAGRRRQRPHLLGRGAPLYRSHRLRAAALLADHRLAIEWWSRLHGGVWPGPGEPAGGPDTLRVRRTPARCSRPGKRGYSRSESQISRRGGSSPTPGPCARSPSCPGRSAPPVSSCS